MTDKELNIKKEKSFVSDWINKRKAVLNNNIVSDLGKVGTIQYLQNNIKQNIDHSLNDVKFYESTPVSSLEKIDYSVLYPSKEVFSKSEIDGALGVYNHNNKRGYIFPDNLQGESPDNVVIHELSHNVTETAPLIKNKITALLNKHKDNLFIKRGDKDSYQDSPEEIWSRMMEFRYNNSIDPSKTYNDADILRLKSSRFTKDVEFINRYSPDLIKDLLNNVVLLKKASNINIV